MLSHCEFAALYHAGDPLHVVSMLCTTYIDPVAFSALVLVEPMLLPPPGGQQQESDMLRAGAAKRRDIWPSRPEALEALQSRPSWKIWDPRVLRLFVVSSLSGLWRWSESDVLPG